MFPLDTTPATPPAATPEAAAPATPDALTEIDADVADAVPLYDATTANGFTEALTLAEADDEKEDDEGT